MPANRAGNAAPVPPAARAAAHSAAWRDATAETSSVECRCQLPALKPASCSKLIRAQAS
jgi:hypothetical protein